MVEFCQKKFFQTSLIDANKPQSANKPSLYVSVKQVYSFWAPYDGDSIASDSAVAPLFSKSIYKATHHKYHIEKVFHYLKKTNAKLLLHLQ